MQRALLQWYKTAKRELPWRQTTDPYKIWLSEVILQQTRVNQGLPYYERFIEKWPNVQTLAQADLQDVLKMWQGLGYYTRARNIHTTANWVFKTLDGKFPSTYNELIQLKGIGPYIAAAIASFSSNEACAVNDGNVSRVLSRLFEVKDAINSHLGKKNIQACADAFLNLKNPADHNQAIMELGALICLPKNPNCLQCPLQDFCLAFQHQSIDQYPKKNPKTKVQHKYFHYFVIYSKKELLIGKRSQQSIWQELFEFPLLSSDSESTVQVAFQTFSKQHGWESLALGIPIIDTKYRHILTHQILHIQFSLLEVKKLPLLENYQKIHRLDIHKYPVPRPIERFLEENLWLSQAGK